MKSATIPVFLLAILVAGTAQAVAERTEYDLSKPIVQQSEWPAGLADLLNSQPPVYAYWTKVTEPPRGTRTEERSHETHHFHYSGDAKAFNAFIERYSKLKDTPLTLVLHPGKGGVKRGPVSDGALQFAPMPMGYDWRVFVVPPMIPDGGIDKNSPFKRFVTADLYLGGSIKLSEISVPSAVKVVSGGEIEKFIAEREKTRGPGLAIYLLADKSINARDALKMKLSDLKQADKPLLTIDDFVSYKWSDHSFVLKPDAAKRIPRPGVLGIPFVLEADGQRMYLGGFWTTISSLIFSGPAVYVDDPLQERTSLEISLPLSGPDGDPRSNPLIKEAFERAGKLE